MNSIPIERDFVGSCAAIFQSVCYGALTPAGSLFSMMQSAGTAYNSGTAIIWPLVVIRVIAGAVGIYVLVAIILA